MFKTNELTSPISCLNKAQDDEMIFVLLGRDPAAPMAIREWVERRIEMGKNSRTDIQIIEAQNCADYMEQNRKRWTK